MSQPLTHPVGELHKIRWMEICPWLILVKALRVTLLIRVLVFAWIGVALTDWGWGELDRLFSFRPATINSEGVIPEEAIPGVMASGTLNLGVIERLSAAPKSLIDPSIPPNGPFLRGWFWLSEPFLRVVDKELSWRSSLGWTLHGIWAIVVWAIFGGSIARIAALYLTRGETIGPMLALRDATALWPGTTGAPLIVLLAAVAMAVPLVLLGFLLRLNLMAVAAGLIWIVVFAWGLMLAVVLLGLLVGWPLMWACLGVERSDAFDGVSRCYAYVYQKPLQLAFYVVVATLLGLLGEGVVTHFAAATISLSEWVLSWGTGSLRAAELLDADWRSSAVPLATRAINGWQQGLESLTASFPLACLWPLSVGIYLLLRNEVDATEMDEVTLSGGNLPLGLPGLTSEGAGASETKQPSTNGTADANDE